MFDQLDCTDNLDAELLSDKKSTGKPIEDFNMGNMESFDNYLGFNQDLLNYEEQLNDQDKQQNDQQDEAEAAGRTLNYLVSLEGIYSPNPHYFEQCQGDITCLMRAILIDWMMEVCNEFTLKRETFYYSLNYVDRFLSVHENIRKEELQLIGVTAMFMAAKMEEVYSPRVADFAKSTDNGYDVTQIVAMEKTMLRELGWYTTPPTYAMWANWYMNQWDVFISTNEYAKTHEAVQGVQDLTFKTSNESAYMRFREVMQIVDLMMLDHN
jgi:cyclin E